MSAVATIAARPVAAPLLGELAETRADVASAALRDRFAAHGYVLLRGLLPPARVEAARAEVLAALREVGEIAGPDETPVATGISRRPDSQDARNAFWRGVSEGSALRACVHATELAAATSALLDAPVVPFDFVWLRAVTAGRASPFHFDHPYMNRGSEHPVTCWVPLGPVRRSNGPIALVENSTGFDDLIARVRGRDVDRETGFSGSLSEDIPALLAGRGTRLLSADFEAGDVLMFGMFVLHGSLDNQAPGGRIRLSCDVRFQPAAEARDDRWFGHPPTGHGGLSYGGLNGALPLTASPIAR